MNCNPDTGKVCFPTKSIPLVIASYGGNDVFWNTFFPLKGSY